MSDYEQYASGREHRAAFDYASAYGVKASRVLRWLVSGRA